MGTVTSSTILSKNGTITSDRERQNETSTTCEGDIVLLHYAYGSALLPQPSDPRRGMWRYSNLLPIDDGPIIYPLPVGDTPLIASHRIREVTNLPHLWLKDETKTVTGSNKDTVCFSLHMLLLGIDIQNERYE